MNKASIPPSPQASHARKPLLNITSFYYNSVDQLKSTTHKDMVALRSGSTKNIRPRKSSGQSNKVNQLRQRKNSLNNHTQSQNQMHEQVSVTNQQIINKKTSNPKTHNIESDIDKIFSKQQKNNKGLIKCTNHQNRKASHQAYEIPSKYFCLECALVLARKSIRINKLKTVLYEEQVKNEPSMKQSCDSVKKRGDEIQNYLLKSIAIHKQLSEYQNNNLCQIKQQLTREYSAKIAKQKQMMEQQLKRVREVYSSHIHTLESRLQTKLQHIKEKQHNVSKLMKMIQNTTIDIKEQMDGIKNKLSRNQFESVINQYWKIVHQAEKLLIQNRNIMNQQTSQFVVDEKEMANSAMENTCEGEPGDSIKKKSNLSKQSKTEFTFSKKEAYGTPEASKTLKGIKFAESEGQSDFHNSSLRQSIVDSKFVFE